METYRYLNINPSTHEVSQGISLRPKLEEDSIFYSDNLNSFTLISKFDQTEYKCTGSCFCEQNNDELSQRRIPTSTKLLTRGLIFLVSALSTHIAINRARQYFDNICKKELSSDCSSTSIYSEVEDCTSIFTEATDDEAIETSEKKKTELDSIDIKNLESEYLRKYSFLCSAHCYPNTKKLYETFHISGRGRKSTFYPENVSGKKQMRRYDKNFKNSVKEKNCEQFRLSKQVSLAEVFDKNFPDREDLDNVNFPSKVDRPDDEEPTQTSLRYHTEFAGQTLRNIRESGDLSEVKEYFLENNLTPFCSKMGGRVEGEFVNVNDKLDMRGFCSEITLIKGGSWGNPSLECTFIYTPYGTGVKGLFKKMWGKIWRFGDRKE